MFYQITCFFLLLILHAASLTFNFTNMTANNVNRDIIIEGNGANISDNGIQLTPNKTDSSSSPTAGRATYIKPLHLWDNRSGELASFSTNFTFVIDSNESTNYGYGLTFFLAQNSSVITQGLAMGLPFNETQNIALSRFVAVEFDTSYDRWDPVVDRGIPMDDHVGIDVNSIASAAFTKWFSNITGGRACQAWITYDSVSKDLAVSFTGFQNDRVVRQDGISYNVDLTRYLPEWVVIGFSASTKGDMFERNIVKSWSFDSSDVAVGERNKLPPIAGPELPTRTRVSVKGKHEKVGLVVGLTVMISFVVVLAFVLWRRKSKIKRDELEKMAFDVEMNNEFETGIGPKRFTYLELALSTSNFDEKNKLGEEGYGRVYKGFLEDSSRYVAVKRMSKSSKQVIEEYASEVRIISQLRHKNLVQLTGWCYEKGEFLLVYDYMENGSLNSHLFKGKSLLTWVARFKIANGLASALWYLHDGWEQCVLHRDVKSSNVMLDSNFNAKLGDFGFAKLVDHEKRLETMMSVKTFGTMASESIVNGKETKESDVFSFGVVALELVCGRKPFGIKAQEKQIRLIEWVWELYETDTLIKAVDPRLGSNFEEEEIKRLMIVGLWCVHPHLELRPLMRQVIQVLNTEASLPVLPSTMPTSSYLTSRISSEFGVASITDHLSSTGIYNTSKSKRTTS